MDNIDLGATEDDFSWWRLTNCERHYSFFMFCNLEMLNNLLTFYYTRRVDGKRYSIRSALQSDMHELDMGLMNWQRYSK